MSHLIVSVRLPGGERVPAVRGQSLVDIHFCYYPCGLVQVGSTLPASVSHYLSTLQDHETVLRFLLLVGSSGHQERKNVLRKGVPGFNLLVLCPALIYSTLDKQTSLQQFAGLGYIFS